MRLGVLDEQHDNIQSERILITKHLDTDKALTVKVLSVIHLNDSGCPEVNLGVTARIIRLPSDPLDLCW